MRESGILLPVSSLSSRYGIGCFSKEAYQFIDLLKEAGQKNWQILPLGPTGFGDSPYQSFSTFAGNPYFIDPELLIADQYLTREECEAIDFGQNSRHVDYGKLFENRFQLLKLAFLRSGFYSRPNDEFLDFQAENAFWLDDYALFMAIKINFENKSLFEWDNEIRLRKPSAMDAYRDLCSENVCFYKFLQYLFFKQWKALKAYAAARQIKIIGDIPIYVSYDSADTWANPGLFQLDGNFLPAAVAGCPPDGFSNTGQLWGNPLYNWDYHQETGFDWWIRRIAHSFTLYDVLRVDHFRGFDEYYSIPFGDSTAENGTWKKGPGYSIFNVLREKLGPLNIIAEDLGYLTDSVIELVAKTGFPGMKILEFAFDSREAANYLPYNYDKNCVVYTGTHDNDTIRGWYEAIRDEDREFTIEYLNSRNTPPSEIHWDFIRLAQGCTADLSIIPMQDYLGLPSEARLNTPSTLGGNWTWRLLPGEFSSELVHKIKQLTNVYGRM